MDKELERLIFDLQVNCPQATCGCDWIGELRHLEKHVSATEEGECLYVEVYCRHGCGQKMTRGIMKEHEEKACRKLPMEVQFQNLQERMERMWEELNLQHRTEIDLLTNKITKQEKEIADLKKEICDLRKIKEPFSTTIPVFSPSVLRIMPKLPSGNIPGVSYYPSDQFVKISGNSKEEMEARTQQFLAEYEKILPHLQKEKFEVHPHYPEQIVQSLITLCNKNFSACYVVACHEPDSSIELISTNGSQFQLAKKTISDKLGERVQELKFPGNFQCLLTLKIGSIIDEMVDVVVVPMEKESVTSNVSLFSSILKALPLHDSSDSDDTINLESFEPGQVVIAGPQGKYKSKQIIYIPTYAVSTVHGYFGKEHFDLLALSINRALQEACKLHAKHIAIPAESSGSGQNMKSMYIVPSVIESAKKLMLECEQRNLKGGASEYDWSLKDIRIIIQDDRSNFDEGLFSNYVNYIANKFNLY